MQQRLVVVFQHGISSKLPIPRVSQTRQYISFFIHLIIDGSYREEDIWMRLDQGFQTRPRADDGNDVNLGHSPLKEKESRTMDNGER